jgi:type I restriction enzyme S subunit
MANWESKPLGVVCEFINRGISPAYLEVGGIAVLNQKCIRDHAVNFGVGRRHDVTAKKVTAERLVRAGDVLVNSTGTGTLGRVAQLREDPPEPTTVDSHVTIVRPTPGLFHPDFFGYALIAIEEQIQEGGEGCGGQTELSRSKLAESYRISFPADRIEQRRIVAILDEAFEAIAIAKANAEKNQQNAREVFSSALAKVFSADWPRVRIEDACQSIMDCVNKTAPTVSEVTPYKMLRTTNVRNGAVSLTSVNYVSEDVYKVWTRRQVPRRGDVILTREAPMGEVGMLESDEHVFLGQRLVSYRTEATKLDGRFLLYALQSEPLQRQIHALASGSTVQHMRVPDSKNLLLPLPCLQQQGNAVCFLDSMRRETTDLEAICARKMSALDELKRSLLNQAFTGALTAKAIDKQVAEAA